MVPCSGDAAGWDSPWDPKANGPHLHERRRPSRAKTEARHVRLFASLPPRVLGGGAGRRTGTRNSCSRRVVGRRASACRPVSRASISSSGSNDIGDARERSQSHHVPATTTWYPGATSGTPASSKRTGISRRVARDGRRRVGGLRTLRRRRRHRRAAKRDVAFRQRSRRSRLGVRRSRLGVRESRRRRTGSRQSRLRVMMRSAPPPIDEADAVHTLRPLRRRRASPRGDVRDPRARRVPPRRDVRDPDARGAFLLERGAKREAEVGAGGGGRRGFLLVAAASVALERPTRAPSRAPVSASRAARAAGERSASASARARRDTSRSISADLSSLAAFSSPSSDRSARARARGATRDTRDHAKKNTANAAKNAAANRFASCRTVAASVVGTIVVGAGAGAASAARARGGAAEEDRGRGGPPAAQPTRYRSDDAAAEGRGNANVAPRSNAEPRESFAAREGTGGGMVEGKGVREGRDEAKAGAIFDKRAELFEGAFRLFGTSAGGARSRGKSREGGKHPEKTCRDGNARVGRTCSSWVSCARAR